MAEGVQVLERAANAAAVVEQHLARGGAAGERVADRHNRQRLRDLGPELIGGVHWGQDQPVDVLVAELGGERALANGIAAGVENQRVAVARQERAACLGDQALLPQILERGAEDPDHAGAPAGERARDRVGLVTHLVGDLADALLGLLGDLNAAQCIGHCGGRYPRGVGNLPDRHALGGRAHAASVDGLTPGLAADLHPPDGYSGRRIDNSWLNRFT